MGNQVVKEDDLQFLKDSKTKKPVILGKGASGLVKLASFNEKRVAVKYYRDFQNDEEMMKEAKQEKDLLGALKHPNIVEFVGFNFEAGFILLEYVDNGDLFTALPKPETRLERHGWGLILGIAEGLAFLHSKDILHLDLKSLNILLTSKWVPKITDVGLARKIQREKHETSPQHMTLAAKFTTQWAPPENFQQPYAFSFKSDIYSFAIILWEILTGKQPWSDLPSWSVPGKVLDGERPPLPPACPPELAAVIHAAWANDPAARPSAKEVLHALKLIDPTDREHGHSHGHGHSHSHLPIFGRVGSTHGHGHQHGHSHSIKDHPQPQTSHSEGFSFNPHQHPQPPRPGQGHAPSPSASLSALDAACHHNRSAESLLPHPPSLSNLSGGSSDRSEYHSGSSTGSSNYSPQPSPRDATTGADVQHPHHLSAHSNSMPVLPTSPGQSAQPLNASIPAFAHSLANFNFKICRKCNSNYDPSKNKKGCCVHTGRWHDSVSDCNLMCGIALASKRELGTCHWSCCYSFDHQGQKCPNSKHKPSHD